MIPGLALLVLVVLVGCDEAPVDAPRDVGLDAHLDAPELARALPPFLPEGGGPVAIGPREERVSSAACGACHAREHAAWTRSAHARSHLDPLYQRELAIRPSRACERCHAPLAEEVSSRTEGAWADEGVGCASCHVRDGVVVHTRASGQAPHETRIDARVGEVEGCRSCHQFHFPAPERPSLHATFDPNDWLQDTVSEWSASAEGARGLTCIGCHLAEDEGRHDHALPGLRDRAMRARALDVEAEVHVERRVDVVTLTLRSRAGHAVPTGDLYRVLEVRAWREGEPASARSEQLGRVYERRGAHRLEVEDDRVMPSEPRVVTLRLPRLDRTDRPVSWTIRVWRLDPAVVRRAQLEDAVHEFAHGRLVPSRRPSEQ
ncbi:MAG: hypothetical protein J0L92_20180 [Deltaproteobacteria bacterium]|nr:hypothetical protein [Deltaproteobacteria bacterium]